MTNAAQAPERAPIPALPEAPHTALEMQSESQRAEAEGTASSLRITESAHGAEPLENDAARSFMSWAERTRTQLEKIYQSPLSTVFSRAQQSKARVRDAIMGRWPRIAYDVYADLEKVQDSAVLAPEEQEQFLRNLHEIANGGLCKIEAQGIKAHASMNGLSPLAALEHDKTAAKALHFYVLPNDFNDRPTRGQDGSHARLTLHLSPSHVVETCRTLVPLFSRFDGMMTQLKVMSPKEQGTRTDSIVVYLNQANLDRAEELAQEITLKVAVDAWRLNIPLGMHSISQGMAYAEFNSSAVSTSFGVDRGDMVIKSLIRSLTNNAGLEEAIQEVSAKRGYLASNPALLAR